jgi:hypothetical protein
VQLQDTPGAHGAGSSGGNAFTPTPGKSLKRAAAAATALAEARRRRL